MTRRLLRPEAARAPGDKPGPRLTSVLLSSPPAQLALARGHPAVKPCTSSTGALQAWEPDRPSFITLTTHHACGARAGQPPWRVPARDYLSNCRSLMILPNHACHLSRHQPLLSNPPNSNKNSLLRCSALALLRVLQHLKLRR